MKSGESQLARHGRAGANGGGAFAGEWPTIAVQPFQHHFQRGGGEKRVNFALAFGDGRRRRRILQLRDGRSGVVATCQLFQQCVMPLC